MIPDENTVTLLRDEIAGVVSIYRFGSTSTGGEHAGSDVDVAVLADRPLDPVRRFRVQEKLAALLRRDVDLVDLRAASTVMQMQVVAHGQLIAEFDAPRRVEFEDLVFSSYARLNEERRGILERISKEGSVYGG